MNRDVKMHSIKSNEMEFNLMIKCKLHWNLSINKKQKKEFMLIMAESALS